MEFNVTKICVGFLNSRTFHWAEQISRWGTSEEIFITHFPSAYFPSCHVILIMYVQIVVTFITNYVEYSIVILIVNHKALWGSLHIQNWKETWQSLSSHLNKSTYLTI